MYSIYGSFKYHGYCRYCKSPYFNLGLLGGAIPSLNLPVKSVPALPVQPRRELV